MIELSSPLALVLLPAPLLVWWLFPPYRQVAPALRFPFFRQLVTATSSKALDGSVIVARNPMQMAIAVCIWLLVVLALAAPVRVGEPLTVTKATRDLVLAIDISGSMDDRDFKDASGAPLERLAAVKEIVGDFIEKRAGDRVALIVFGSQAFLQAPFTEDLEGLRELLEQTEVGMAGPHTALGDAIGLAIRTFETSDLDQRVLLVLSDGADTGSRMSPVNAAEIAAQNGIEIHTIGVGQPEGTGENRMDVAALTDIARRAGGQFFFADDTEGLAQVYARIEQLTPRSTETLSHRPREALGHWPLGLASVLALLATGFLHLRGVRA